MLGRFSFLSHPSILFFFFFFLINNIDRTDWIFYNRVAEYVCSIVWLPRRFITVTLESQIRQFCSLVKTSIWKEVNTKEFMLNRGHLGLKKKNNIMIKFPDICSGVCTRFIGLISEIPTCFSRWEWEHVQEEIVWSARSAILLILM